MEDVSKLIGIPYDECDCWALVLDYYKDYLGMELKSYIGRNDKIQDLELVPLITTCKGDFVEVPLAERRQGDIITMKIKGVECHIGVMLSRTDMLHTTKTTGSVVDKVNRWTRQITGCYRVKGAAE